MDLNRILVPVDFSEYSEKAIQAAAQMCSKFDAELHLLHVLEVRVSGPPQFAMGLAVSDRGEESAAAVMAELKQLPGEEWDGTVVRATAHGAPIVAINEYAKDHQVDLIMLGTQGRTGLSHLLLGSVAENVSRHAPCSVMVVR